MSWLRDGLGFLSEQAKAALTPVEVKTESTRTKTFLLGDKIIEIDLLPKDRHHQIDSLADFVALANTCKGSASIWHNTGSIVLLMDDTDRRDTAVMHLRFTQLFESIRETCGKWLDQKTFVQLLKSDWRDAVAESVRAAVSKIEVASSAGMKSEVAAGRERGSREFASNVVSEEVPEFFDIAFRVYNAIGMEWTTRTRLYLQYNLPPQPLTFRMTPELDALDAAIRTAQAQLHTHLVEKCPDIPVYHGCP